MDELLSVLRHLLRIAGVHYPLRVLGGVSFGIIVHGFVRVAASSTEARWLDAASALPLVYFVALGLFIAVVTLQFSQHGLSEGTLRDISLIEHLIELGDLGELDKRQAWRAILLKSVDKFQADVEPDEPSVRSLDPQRLADDALAGSRADEKT